MSSDDERRDAQALGFRIGGPVIPEAPVQFPVTESIVDGSSALGSRLFGGLAILGAAVAAILAFFLAPRALTHTVLNGTLGDVLWPFSPVYAAFWAPTTWLSKGDLVAAGAWMQLLTTVTTFAFVMASYVALRRGCDHPPAICLAAVVPVALHPVLARFGGGIAPDFLAGALAMVVVAGLSSNRLESASRAGINGGGGEPLKRRMPRIHSVLRSVERWWPTSLLLALAMLSGLGTATLLLALWFALVSRRRWQDATTVLATTAALILPWGAWTWMNFASGHLARGEEFGLGQFLGAFWLAFGHALPGFVIPQAFLDGYPLTTNWKPTWSWPEGIVAVGGLFVSFSLARAIWAELKASTLASHTCALYTLMTIIVTLFWTAVSPKMSVDLPARLLLPIAPFLLAGIWRFRGGRHRFERLGFERIKAKLALAWAALVCVLSPWSLWSVWVNNL